MVIMITLSVIMITIIVFIIKSGPLFKQPYFTKLPYKKFDINARNLQEIKFLIYFLLTLQLRFRYIDGI